MRTVYYLCSVFLVWFLCPGCSSSQKDAAEAAEKDQGNERLEIFTDETVIVPESELSFPEGIRHVLIEPSNGKYKFLHDPAVTDHKGELIAAWYNCPEEEISDESCIRARRSSDNGVTWSEIEVVAEDTEKKGIHYVPAQMLSFQDDLYAFVGTMTDHDRIINTTTYRYDAGKKSWGKVGVTGELFLPNCAPVKLKNGNWMIAGRVAASPGELPLIPAVLVSAGDDLEKDWKVVRLQETEFSEGQHPETTIIPDSNRIYAFTRVNSKENKPDVFISNNYGETWEKVKEHNFSALSSKLYAGRLRDGRGYIVFNYPVSKPVEENFKARTVLAIAVSENEENPFSFSKIYKIQSPGPGSPLLSHYPSVHEYGNELYIVYTANFPDEEKRQCELSIVPTKSLR